MTGSNPKIGAKPCILAIDDTPENLLTLKEVLGSEFSLQFATSGATGLALAEAAPPDLILLDVMMPEMDGHEVYRRLKAEPRLPLCSPERLTEALHTLDREFSP